jgi:hypothetical protein
MSLQVHHSRDFIRVLILGTGQMGGAIARLVLAKQGLELVAYGRRPERAGIDLGRRSAWKEISIFGSATISWRQSTQRVRI